VRAGNVVGGGDWARDRLVPDIISGCLGPAGSVEIRNPAAVRPWQHVLEPLAGYLTVAERLIEAPEGMDRGWNFGPSAEDCRPVAEVAEAIVETLGRGTIETPDQSSAPHEAKLLRLDSTRARQLLGWKPRLTFGETIEWTAEWYLRWSRGEDMRAFTSSQIADYVSKAANGVERPGVRSAGTSS
jgi:CDP-glucose 4,6-dehydratase